MTYTEAVTAMRAGHPVTRDFWDDGDLQHPILFIRPEWETTRDAIGIVKSVSAEVRRYMKSIDLEVFEFSETLCYYQAGHVINGFIPTTTDKGATDWRRVYV